MKSTVSKVVYVLAMTFLLSLPNLSFAQAVEEKPSAMAMIGDLLIARPFLLAITAVGSTAYVVSLPFTLAGGNSREAAETLVIRPAASTFVRCLGCTKVGRKKHVLVDDAEMAATN